MSIEMVASNTFVYEIMINLINEMPGKWMSSENYKGESVNQKLVFSFQKNGC